MSRTNTRRASAQHRPAGPTRDPPDWTLCPTPKLFLSLPLSLSSPAKCSVSMLPISSTLGITYVKVNNYTFCHPGHGSNANSSTCFPNPKSLEAFVHDPGVYSQSADTDLILAGSGLASPRSRGVMLNLLT